ncbi:MAG: hypothetical protein OIF58_14420 [Cohaesibacter sp.]|nr:hypothetical protein [Cohaesibacter sp.]
MISSNPVQGVFKESSTQGLRCTKPQRGRSQQEATINRALIMNVRALCQICSQRSKQADQNSANIWLENGAKSNCLPNSLDLTGS